MGRVSVVVSAYNEERHIERLLRSLSEQTLAPYEVIVVDDGSTDATASLARSVGAQVITIVHAGPAIGRNVGARRATGEVLVFVDGDMACSPTFVECLTASIFTGQAVGTFTRDIYVGEPANAWSRSYCYIRRLGYPRLLSADSPDVSANFRSISRQAFLGVHGYDDVGYGEDMTLAPKLGLLATAAPGAACDHYNPDTPREIFQNARWIARGRDVQLVPHPVRDNLACTALSRGLRDLARGAPVRVLVARQIYSVGFLLGMLQRRRRPARHAK